uniref:F-box protein At5g07610-like n=1 Tax=Fragaria vesca subsp. vesca TaxID=101020 RepID=UPI0005CAB9B8|nr:PREDICTED: F-box protein At5g07610-like [Fragaria vesca subsp. vesca]
MVSSSAIFLSVLLWYEESIIPYTSSIQPPTISPSVNKFAFNSSYGLAFDPSKSPHYKVVCVTSFVTSFNSHSYDGEWKHLDTPDLKHFGWTSRALYCNGAIHWIRDSADAGFHWRGRIGDDASGRWMRDEDDVVHYFDICEEQLRLAAANLPVPLFVQNTSVKDFGIFPTGWPRLFHRHFGVSGGCLYFIETYEHCSTRFEILEMERDYSAWLVKYYVDLNLLVAALPGQDWNAFVILGLSQEEGTSQ